MTQDGSNAGRILFVCAGNICRSPYAERRMRQLLGDLGILVASAGTSAVVGADIEPATREQLHRRGADVTGFAAQQVTRELVDCSDLVLTMTRAQRGEVARLRPMAMRHIFALGDFADLCASSHAWRPMATSNSLLTYIAAEAATARGTVAPRHQTQIDVGDPYGRSSREHSEAFQRIDGFIDIVSGTFIDASRRLTVQAPSHG